MILGCVLLGCGRTPAEPVRVGYSLWPGSELLPLAASRGYFADEHVDVQLVELGALSDVRRVFERGQVDAMACTPAELLVARAAADRHATVVAVLDVSTGADVVLGGPRVAGLKDLRGRRIAVEPGSVGLVMLARALDTAGLAWRDATRVPLAQSEMAAALADGRVDAVVTYAPYAERLDALPGVHRVFDSAAIRGEIVDVLAVDERLARERPDATAAIARAVARARDLVVGDPDAVVPFIAADLQMAPDDVRAVLHGGMTLPSLAEQRAALAPGGQVETTLAHVASVLTRTGQLDAAPRLVALVAPREARP
jgi:NitT/TauT family transport system substrate-binding protein